MKSPSTVSAWVVALWLAACTAAWAQPTPVQVPTPAGEVTLLADQLEELGPDGVVVATGNAELTRGTARLLADRIELNRETGDAVARGRVIFYDGEDRLTAERIDYNFRTGTGVVYEADGRMAPYYRLRGERLERLGEGVYRVQRGVFTTCEADPPAWSVRMGSAVADFEDFIWGRDASFWVRNLPLIPWVPFFLAPIRRERQSGFLFPKFGMSSRKGAFAEVPFYWAISDSQDLTVSLNAYARRGVGGTADYRYILSRDHLGTFRGFLLQETEVEDRTRGWFGLQHAWALTPRLSLRADVKAVTDDDVLREYSDGLHQRGQQRVESNVFLSQRWTSWSFVANAFWYQDLTTPRPVELHRLPDLTLTSVAQPVPGIPGLLWQLDAGAVRFVREVGSDGSRIDVRPRLSLPISLAGLATVTPFAAPRLTAYDRRVTGVRTGRDGVLIEETEDELRLRRLLESGVDVETIAARVYHLGGWQNLEALLHTIEPRIGYVRIDGTNMHQLPAWTAVETIRNTSRIEYAVTNRIRGRTVAPPGTEPVRLEMLRFLIGHSIDLRDDRRRSGDLILDLLLQPTSRLYFRGDAQVDTHGGGVQNLNTDAWVTLPWLTASVGTRYSGPGRINFLQGTVRTDITPYLTARGATNWDLRTNTFVENRVALDLRWQCWAVTVEVIQRSRGEDEVRFAVNLLGLGAPITTAVGLGAVVPPGALP